MTGMKMVYENERLGIRIYEEPEHDGEVVELRAVHIEGRVLAPIDASLVEQKLYRAIAHQRAVESLDGMESFGSAVYSDSEAKVKLTLRAAGHEDSDLGEHHWVYARITAWPKLASFARPKTAEEIGTEFLEGATR